jgi:lipoate-protein ligase A
MPRPPLAIVRLARATVMQQLQLEEALLRSTTRSWFVIGWDPRRDDGAGGATAPAATLPPLAPKPTPSSSSSLLRAQGPPPLPRHDDGDDDSPTIVLGISGKPAELIDLGLCVGASDRKGGGHGAPAALAPTAVRRFSGGGTVVVGRGTVLTSLIVSKEDLEARGVEPFPHPLMRWTAKVYARAFEGKEEAQQDAEEEERAAAEGSGSSSGGGGSSPPPPIPPFFALRENDYCARDRKIAGNAQAIAGKGRALHHTSFLWDWRDDHMRLLLSPKKQPEYRRRRGHGSFLARVRERWPGAFPRPEDLALALEGAVADEWGASASAGGGGGGAGVEEADEAELRAALAGSHLRGNRRVDLRQEWELALASRGGGARGEGGEEG